MELQISLLMASLVVVFFHIYYYSIAMKHKNKQYYKKLPPEAAGGWPFIGHLKLLRGPQLHHIILGRLSDKYGPIFTIRLGAHRGMITCSSEVAKACFRGTNDIILSNRPQTASTRHMTYNFTLFGFSDYGPYWCKLHKITTLHSLSSQKIASFSHMFKPEIRGMMKTLYDSGNVMVEKKKYFAEKLVNVMVKLIAGSTEKNVESGDRRNWQGAMREFFKMLPMGSR